NNAVISSTTAVTGSIADSNLDSWVLELAPWGTERFAVLAQGGSAVNGALGEIDPAGLRNDVYRLRLTARDIGGRSARAAIRVEGSTATKAGGYPRQGTHPPVPPGPITLAVTPAHDPPHRAAPAHVRRRLRQGES